MPPQQTNFTSETGRDAARLPLDFAVSLAKTPCTMPQPRCTPMLSSQHRKTLLRKSKRPGHPSHRRGAS